MALEHFFTIEVFNKAEMKRFVAKAPVMAQNAIDKEIATISRSALKWMKKSAPRGHHKQATGRGKQQRIVNAPGPHLKDSFHLEVDLGKDRVIQMYSTQPYAKYVLEGHGPHFPKKKWLRWVDAGPRGGRARIMFTKHQPKIPANRFDEKAYRQMQPDMTRALDRIGNRIEADWRQF